MDGTFLFLGSGGSLGIPVIGCSCVVCESNDPKNTRLRPSALLKVGKKQFLIDAGPDIRLQSLRYKINISMGLYSLIATMIIFVE